MTSDIKDRNPHKLKALYCVDMGPPLIESALSFFVNVILISADRTPMKMNVLFVTSGLAARNRRHCAFN
jgi:hypothetical protein